MRNRDRIVRDFRKTPHPRRLPIMEETMRDNATLFQKMEHGLKGKGTKMGDKETAADGWEGGWGPPSWP